MISFVATYSQCLKVPLSASLVDVLYKIHYAEAIAYCMRIMRLERM